MRRRSSRWIPSLLALCAFGLGCDPYDVRTEQDQVDLHGNLHSYAAPYSSHEIVEGSTVCIEYDGYRTSDAEPPRYEGAEDAAVRACYDEALDGLAEFDAEGCISLPEVGRVTWSLTRRPCDLPDTFGDDQVIFEVVPVSDVRGAFRAAVPPPAAIDGVALEGVDALPDGYVAPVGEPLRVIAEGLRAVETAVIRRDGLETVAVTDPTVVGEVVEGSPMLSGGSGLTASVTAQAGDVLDLTIALPAGELPVGEVHVVAQADIASMTLHPVVLRLAGTDQFVQLGAVALTRDAEGRVLREPPVQWELVEGDAELATDDLDMDGAADPSDTASLANACAGAERGERRSATLAGSIGGLSDTVRVEWECIDAPEDGCACRARPGGAGHGWLLALGLLGFAWRRRR